MYVFFFNDTATTEIYTLSLHDALPICADDAERHAPGAPRDAVVWEEVEARTSEQTELSGAFIVFMVVAGLITAVGLFLDSDRKSTRLNSSHANISYAVFCLKKKKETKI